MDRSNPSDTSEIERIYTIAKDLLNTNVPNFDFDQIMRPTIQGNDCDYQWLNRTIKYLLEELILIYE